MYNVNKTIDSESSNTTFMDVGIHDNVEMTAVEYKVSHNNNEFLTFTFDKDGKKLEHTEWVPRDTDPQKLENKTLNQIKRIKHIVTKFISEDDYTISADNFKSFAEQTIASLGEAYKGVKVRIKVVYNFQNFTSLPKYRPFIELMSVTESNLEILSIDKMKKDQADKEAGSNVNPFADSTATEPTKVEVSENGGLPF